MLSESISTPPIIIRRERNPRAKLTDKELSQAKPAFAQYKLYDGNGLHLIVTPGGSKLWRWKYSKASRCGACVPWVGARFADKIQRPIFSKPVDSAVPQTMIAAQSSIQGVTASPRNTMP